MKLKIEIEIDPDSCSYCAEALEKIDFEKMNLDENQMLVISVQKNVFGVIEKYHVDVVDKDVLRRF